MTIACRDVSWESGEGSNDSHVPASYALLKYYFATFPLAEQCAIHSKKLDRPPLESVIWPIGCALDN